MPRSRLALGLWLLRLGALVQVAVVADLAGVADAPALVRMVLGHPARDEEGGGTCSWASTSANAARRLAP
jgi:hypothetical protein